MAHAEAHLPAAACAKGVVLRTTALMRMLAEAREPQSIKGLGERLGLAPSTVHRLLEELVHTEWVVRTPQRRNRAALQFFRLGALTTQHIAPVALARPVLAEIVARCDETAIFAMHVKKDARMVFVDKRDPSHPLRYRFRMHEARPLVWGAPGRAILAHLPAEVQRAAVCGAGRSESGRLPPSWDEWLGEAATVRRRGWAMSRGAFIDWAVGFAAPVFGGADEIVGALAIAVPEARLRPGQDGHFIHTLTRQARLLSASLGAARRWVGTAQEAMQ